MTSLLDERNSSYCLQDYFNEEERCTIGIKVKTMLYPKGDQYYDISYNYQYSTTDSKHLNPFYESDPTESREGDVVRRNPMTEQMVNTLLMSESEVEKISGRTSPNAYKALVMKSLAMFWD